jgi:hypothetical protein
MGVEDRVPVRPYPTEVEKARSSLENKLNGLTCLIYNTDTKIVSTDVILIRLRHTLICRSRIFFLPFLKEVMFEYGLDLIWLEIWKFSGL